MLFAARSKRNGTRAVIAETIYPGVRVNDANKPRLSDLRANSALPFLFFSSSPFSVCVCVCVSRNDSRTDVCEEGAKEGKREREIKRRPLYDE